MNKTHHTKDTKDREGWTKPEIVACVVAALFLAALQIVFFTPVVFGGNER